MRFDIFTLFPEMLAGPFDSSILKRARDAGLVEISLHNIRDYALDRHQVTDDIPYGGGGGMVMKPEPIFQAVESVLGEDLKRTPAVPIVLLTPQGRVFKQSIASEFAQHDRLALICGRYEGVDERVRRYLATDELSIGDYVLTGGELAAMVVVDVVARLIPGVLGARWAAEEDSHAMGLLEYPHYTRPPVFRGWEVPEVLRSGDHATIERWRREQALLRTWQRRPDLLESTTLGEADRRFLAGLAPSDTETSLNL